MRLAGIIRCIMHRGGENSSIKVITSQGKMGWIMPYRESFQGKNQCVNGIRWLAGNGFLPRRKMDVILYLDF